MQTRSKGVTNMVQSKALPFLEAPKKLDGSLVGDFGFDPMGISDQVTGLGQDGVGIDRSGRIALLSSVWHPRIHARRPTPHHTGGQP